MINTQIKNTFFIIAISLFIFSCKHDDSYLNLDMNLKEVNNQEGGIGNLHF